MGKLRVGADIRLHLTAKVDVATGSVVMKWIRPGNPDVFEGAVVVENAAICQVVRDFTPAENCAGGRWRFWLEGVKSDGKRFVGETYYRDIFEPGE
jgi:hypothetical protein